MSGKRTQCPPPPHTNPREKAIIVGKQRRDANTLGTHYTHIYFYTILRVFMCYNLSFLRTLLLAWLGLLSVIELIRQNKNNKSGSKPPS